MALEEKDLEQIQSAVKGVFAPMERKIEKMNQTLYGDNGLPGLCQIVQNNTAEIKEHKKEFNAFRLLFETGWGRVLGIVIGIQFVVVAVSVAVKVF